MHKSRRFVLLLTLALLFAPFAHDYAAAGLFSSLKEKATVKSQQLQTKEWWAVKISGKVAGFVTGKALGIAGAGVGAALGFCLGGGPGAALGAWLGNRLTSVAARTFAKPVGEIIAQERLAQQEQTDSSNKTLLRPFSWQEVKDAVATVDKKALSAESVGAVLGDLLGGTIGVAAGLAFCAGMGPIAIPLVGAVSAAWLGQKVGRWLGASIGRAVLRRAAKTSYQVLAPTQKIASPTAATTPAASTTNPPAQTAGDQRLLEAQRQYQEAYLAYTQTATEQGVSAEKRQLMIETLRNAQAALDAAQKAAYAK